MSWSLAGFLTDDEVARVFRNVRKLLTPQGLFILDVQNARGIKMELLNRWFIDRQAYADDVKIVRLNFSRPDRPDVLDWRACYLIQKGVKFSSIFERAQLRFFNVESLRRLLKENRFTVSSVWAEPRKPFEANALGFYVVGRLDFADR